MSSKKKTRMDLQDEALSLYYNKNATPKEIALIVGKSPRTVYRWLKQSRVGEDTVLQSPTRGGNPRQKYAVEVFEEIKRLKMEVPARSATTIQTMLKHSFSPNVPSLSTIRKYIAKEGLSKRKANTKLGYIKFERKYPNDLWQIDIAGVQSIEKVGKVYLFAVLDDCSRFIPAAFYSKDEKGRNVIELLRKGFMDFGRPRQILADNGRQFRSTIGELGTKYTKLLQLLDIEPIFAKPYHPQTKGKLERWFGTVVKSFLSEVRFKVKSRDIFSLKKLNEEFSNWLQWYNYEKPHRSLPKSTNPADIYLNHDGRIYRPLNHKIKWDRWLGEFNQRKVTKYNEIKYKGILFGIPSGYSGFKVDLIEIDNTLEVFYQDQSLCIHKLPDFGLNINNKREKRKISQSGQIRYRNKSYSIDYKLAGKKVEVQESNASSTLLVYYKNLLIKQLPLSNPRK